MTKIMAFAVLGLFAFPLAASAQPVRAEDSCAMQWKGRIGKPCDLRMDDGETFTGKELRPAIEGPITDLRGARHKQLIRYRTHFFDRIVASTEDR